jgi:hypothetical protein
MALVGERGHQVGVWLMAQGGRYGELDVGVSCEASGERERTQMSIASKDRVTFRAPIKLESLANSRLHWARKARIVAGQRAVVKLILAGEDLPALPATVTLTRVGKRKVDDDNLAYLFKGTRDEVAAAMGVDDGSPLYRWEYRQEIGKEYGVRIEIESN